MQVVDIKSHRVSVSTTTLGALAAAEPTLTRLSDIRLPAKTAYQLSRWLRVVNGETRHYHTQRDAFIHELGVVDPVDPTRIHVTPDNTPEFVKRMVELSAVEVELTLAPISLSLLFSVDLSPMEILSLEPVLLIDDDGE